MSTPYSYWEWRFQIERMQKRAAIALAVLVVLAWAGTSIRLAKSRMDRRLDEATRTGVLR